MWTQGASPVEDHGHKKVQVPFMLMHFYDTVISAHILSGFKIKSLKTEGKMLPI